MAYSIGDGVAYDQSKSMKLIREAAEQGLGSAQFTLGMKYAGAEGLTQDYAQAVKWLRKASKQGIGEATFQLRRCETMLKHKPSPKPTIAVATPAIPSTGPSKAIETQAVEPIADGETSTASVPPPANIGKDTLLRLQQARHLLLVERKTAQAKKILGELAQIGVPEAQRLLGIAHYRSQDYKEAHAWLLQAAQRNDPQAQRYLGMTYFLGQGVNRDYSQASVWLGKAAAQGDDEATRYREILRKFYQE